MGLRRYIQFYWPVPCYISILSLLLCHAVFCVGWSGSADQKIALLLLEENIMSKEKRTNRESKKQALMTPREKKAAKKLKKKTKGLFANDPIL